MAIISDWTKSISPPGYARAVTTVPVGTRLLNPDFIQGNVFWSTYGVGAAWVFVDDGVEASLLAGQSSQDLVNASGAIAAYTLRINSRLPVVGLTYAINAYNGGGGIAEVIVPATPMTGDDLVYVNQTVAGRIGIVITNTTGGTLPVHLNLFSTVVKTYLLYQAIPLGVESVRIRVTIPERAGSMRLLVYSFNDPEAPTQNLLQDLNLIRIKGLYELNVNVPNPTITKYVGLYAVVDYDETLISYFNVNSVPSIWVHDQIGRTNNFFGVQYDSSIELVFNVQAGQIRIFNSLGIMSEAAWSVESFLTSDGQISMLGTDNFRLRDGMYSAAILRDILTPQDALPDPVNNKPILHGTKLSGVWIRMVLRNSETLRQIELRAVYLGSDELAGNLLAKK